VDDLLTLASQITGPSAPPGFGEGLPLFGLGCSLGGCIVLQASMRRVRAPRALRGQGLGCDEGSTLPGAPLL
jgi:alpha-beta hydrolase superfamily lysophospholipase